MNDDIIGLDHERQQQIRNRMLSKIDQKKSQNHFRLTYWMKKVMPILAVLMIFAISATLYLSETSEKNSLGQGQNHISSENSTVSSDINNRDLQFDIDKQTEKKIEKIQASDFELRLPQKTPETNMEIANVVKRKAMSGHNVTVIFNHQGKKAFRFSQESITKKDKNHVNQKKQEIKSEIVDQFKVKGHTGYVTDKNWARN